MALMKILMIGAAMLIAANTALANTDDAYGAILPEGAKIVAGDINKNEFYILDKGEKLPESPPTVSQQHNGQNQKLATATQVVHKEPSVNLSKKHLASSAKTINKVDVDKLNRKKLADNKVIMKLNGVFTDKDRKEVDKFLRKLVDKKEISQLRKALKHGDQKAISANIQKRVGKKTFLKLQNELAHKQRALLKDKNFKHQLANTRHRDVKVKMAQKKE